MKPKSSKLRLSLKDFLNSSVTFVAKAARRVVGTATAKKLCPGGLPSGQLFEQEIIALDSQEFTIMESTKFACEKSEATITRGLGGMSLAGSGIISALFKWSVINGISDWLVVVNPRVVDFYREKLGFDILAIARECPHVQGAPGVLLRCKIKEVLAAGSEQSSIAQQFFLRDFAQFQLCHEPYRLRSDEIATLIIEDPTLVWESNSQERICLTTERPALTELLVSLDNFKSIARELPEGIAHFLALRVADVESGNNKCNFPLRRTISPIANLLAQFGAELEKIIATAIDDGVPDQLYGNPVFLVRAVIELAKLAVLQKIASIKIKITSSNLSDEKMLTIAVSSEGNFALAPEALRILAFESNAEIRIKQNETNCSCLIVEIPFELSSSTEVAAVLQGLESTEEETKQQAGKLTVLVVDDNLVCQVVLKRLIEKYGNEVDLAKNGYDCLSKIRIKDYDIIFMDLQMPEMDGFEAVRHIRQLEIEQSSKVVLIYALTSFVMPGDFERTIEAGMNGYLAKPVSELELKQILVDVSSSIKRQNIMFEDLAVNQ